MKLLNSLSRIDALLFTGVKISRGDLSSDDLFFPDDSLADDLRIREEKTPLEEINGELDLANIELDEMIANIKPARHQ